MDQQQFDRMCDEIMRDWVRYSADWQVALEEALARGPGQAFRERAQLVVLAYVTAQQWVRDIAEALGLGKDRAFSDVQSLSSFLPDDDDELFMIGVDLTDPDKIGLYWSVALALGSDPQPVTDYDSALQAAREHLELPDRPRPQLH